METSLISDFAILSIAMGLMVGYGALANRFRDAALLVVALFAGGLVLGRLVSLMLDGSPNEAIWALLIVESVGCVVAALLFLRKVDSRGDGA